MFACVKHEEARQLLGVTKENAQQALNNIWKQADADARGAITFDEFEPFVDLLRGSSSSGQGSSSSAAPACEPESRRPSLLKTQKSWRSTPEELQEKSVRV